MIYMGGSIPSGPQSRLGMCAQLWPIWHILYIRFLLIPGVQKTRCLAMGLIFFYHQLIAVGQTSFNSFPYNDSYMRQFSGLARPPLSPRSKVGAPTKFFGSLKSRDAQLSDDVIFAHSTPRAPEIVVVEVSASKNQLFIKIIEDSFFVANVVAEW